VATLAIAALVAIAYVRTNACDPGLTTEAALLLTLLLSGLTMGQPALASGLAVTLVVDETVPTLGRGVVAVEQSHDWAKRACQ